MDANQKCEVELWQARVADVEALSWPALMTVLDTSERLCASQLRRAVDRQAYVLAHGLRRLALARVLQVPAAALVFRWTDLGQPLLAWPQTPGVFFSHSHTRVGVLFALSLETPLGVDIEQTCAEPPDMAHLEPFLRRPEPAPATSFYRYWTAIEAFCKAAGTGLSELLPRIECSAHALGLWMQRTESASGATLSSALVMPVAAPLGCVASLALATAVSTQPVIRWRELAQDFAILKPHPMGVRSRLPATLPL